MPPKAATETSKSLKRPASDVSSDDQEEAASKRPRRGTTNYEAGAHSEKKHAKTTKSAAAKSSRPVKEKAAPLNPLRQPAPKARPPRQLFVFGNGDFGQLGLGPDETTELTKPKLHAWCAEAIEEGRFGEPGAGIEAVAAGGMHSLMLDEQGKVWSWGVNDDSALGRQTEGVKDADGNPVDQEELSATPHVIDALVEQKFRAVVVVAGDCTGAALSDKGELRIWGTFRSPEGQKAFSSTEKAKDGAARAAGASETLHPVALPGFKSIQIAAISAGANHVIALTTDGLVYGWGSSEQGQIGRKVVSRHRKNGMEPERLDIREAVVVGTGDYHSFAVDKSGTVWAWGLNSWGQLGFKSAANVTDSVHYTVEDVPSLHPDVTGSRVVQIAGGEHHTLFRLEDGRVFAVGRNDGGQLGVGPDHPSILADPDAKGMATFEPVQVPIQGFVTDIQAGPRYNLALTDTGILFSWGQGNLGISRDVSETSSPTLIAGRESSVWKCLGMTCGGQHSFIIVSKKEPDEELTVASPAPVIADAAVNGVH
ncbi:Guanine nucleotide exchange factor SRM1 AltName: Full=Pheromone response pathway component SRM1; AltName: Full=Pre-mRNA-processing protein 20; AltName: Full=Regulator of chromosome condensation; AltName: Full=Suppressor of receptor mutations 1; AltName: Full=mRNA transport protein 1 [Serendipita indica DSM 11827]|uniref:Related to Pim1 protein (Poly(A)+ RNA transport protein 2), putative-Cryptococcus neoformans n=1 Tax=Serendipita indica (strain DSM 11827) TaxID=1109443 RepID=G4T7B8_SERID|nr:Guanine nucleotide exchange factor SRM1 AltName: Full=Pheromone response pathway component SRM1; AltName: Full=Pre-mRNA-processing protein 20; AltName: Full=Regulator of chromosome condensation; AltName: Full=Suppressor of receptor mutations 1; AltName: Full=mRNA transport protein 1 [Serendipita indica DSM 11827]CCA67214.1 related to Pim1 protein (Poly(A)+ RNA transport protein 2), putative-Cryptococcus neoformans [Serendipita indica DSM 11827]